LMLMKLEGKVGLALPAAQNFLAQLILF